jgi:hypothetical protein
MTTITMHFCRRLNKPCSEVRVVDDVQGTRINLTECPENCRTCNDCEEVPITIGPVDSEYMETEAVNRRKMHINIDVEGPWTIKRYKGKI